MAGSGTGARVGLIGHPVAHSRSPAMQQAAFDALGIAVHYELWDTPTADLAARVAALRRPDVLGANVTIPHKLAVLPLLDEQVPEARRIAGAVNTIVRVETGAGVRLIGHNTDVAGLTATLRDAGIQLAGRRVVLLGAGGAAQAMAGLAAHAGAAALVVAARRAAAAERLIADITARQARRPPGAHALDLADTAALRAALRRCDLLLNATSAGMGDPAAAPMPLDLVGELPREAFVLDIVYTPPETALLRAARAAGLAAANGLPMLLYQGAAAFELWTGRPAPLAVMRAALDLG
ncbi:MAG: shikimate dehydrogenase [Ktedonobacterales bacterium]